MEAGASFSLSVARAADAALDNTLTGVENRYNRAKTLELSFTETYTLHGQKKMAKGELYLRKPGRMRWQYSEPAGELFVSDGKFLYSYIPGQQQAEKNSMKATEDMRAPLAFLLGHLKFTNDFRDFQSHPESGGLAISAVPKSDKLPYSQVSFLVAPDDSIKRLTVTGDAVLEYSFENEKMGLPLSDKLFQFQPPAGVPLVDMTSHQ